MRITRSSVDTAIGPADWFTGDVYIDSVAAALPPSARRPVTDAEYDAAPPLP